MNRLFSLAAAAIAVLAVAAPAHAVSVSIDAQSNIFRASPTGGGGGVLPVSFSFTAGAGQALTFSSVTGVTNCCGSSSPATPPDGNAATTFGNTNVNSSGGISGIIGPGEMFLVGVFVDSSGSFGAAPTRLDYNSVLSTSSASYSPLLNQTFFIGDGLTGSGSGDVQQFLVPELADTLFLGFADAAAFNGNPGFYTDNRGALAATFDVAAVSQVPLPASLPLIVSAIGLLSFVTRRRNRRAA